MMSTRSKFYSGKMSWDKPDSFLILEPTPTEKKKKIQTKERR